MVTVKTIRESVLCWTIRTGGSRRFGARITIVTTSARALSRLTNMTTTTNVSTCLRSLCVVFVECVLVWVWVNWNTEYYYIWTMYIVKYNKCVLKRETSTRVDSRCEYFILFNRTHKNRSFVSRCANSSWPVISEPNAMPIARWKSTFVIDTCYWEIWTNFRHRNRIIIITSSTAKQIPNSVWNSIDPQ